MATIKPGSRVSDFALPMRDVIKPKSLYGRKYLGVERGTFPLDGSARLRQEWRQGESAWVSGASP
jgi:hypothetical protein